MVLNKNIKPILLNVFSIVLIITGCNSSSNYIAKTDVKKEIIHIGPTREIKSLEIYFRNAYEVRPKNVHLIVDGGNYTSDNSISVIGENIIIEGKGRVNLYCTKLYDNVMWITGTNIIVRNLRMKHLMAGTPLYQNCSGRVIGFDNASNIIIEK